MEYEYFIRKVINWEKLEEKFWDECTGAYNRNGTWFGTRSFRKKPREVFAFFKRELTGDESV